MNTEHKLAIVCITENGKKLSLKINSLMKKTHVYVVKNKVNNLSVDNEIDNVFLVEKKLSELVQSLFKEYESILFIMATGIVVRVIAPHIKNKFVDPAILVSDEKGKNVISLLSGHMGGANELTEKISRLIDANPVITTATDVNEKSALDVIAKKLDAHIDDFRENVKDVNSMLVNNKDVHIYIDGDYKVDTRGFKVLEDLHSVSDYKSIEKIIAITNKEIAIGDKPIDSVDKNEYDFLNEDKLSTYLQDIHKKIVKVVPRDIVIGIGCRRNTESELLQECLNDLLHKYNIDANSIKLIGSIDVKHDEKAIIDLAKNLSVPFVIIGANEISKVDYLFDKSEFVKKNVGVYSVSEPVAYILSEGNLIIEKHKYKGITISVGRVAK